MQASELRIGNFIQLGSSIVHVTHFDIRQISRGSVYEPIPLTPEILEACGFKVTSKGFYQHPNWYNLSLKFMKGTYALRCNFMDVVATNIEHLHQLQNVYHSLTGEELTINFPVMSKN